MDARKRYEQWLTDPVFDEATKAELRAIEGDENAIKERFTGDLEFGTGGMRGIIGAGTTRMNVYTIRKATQGLAAYILKHGDPKKGVAISYDCRRRSPEFADEAALCLCANGIPVYVFRYLHPTPMLSFAVRDLGCTAGINVTASHNPPEYNGYKVYWDDGAQVTIPHDEGIIAEVNAIGSFADPKTMPKEEAIAKGLYHVIPDTLDDHFFAAIKQQIQRPEIIKEWGSKLNIVYTPLHGTGGPQMKRMFEEVGFTNYHMVEEQMIPDSEFSTVAYPNPEDPAAFELALKLAEKVHADVAVASDPDADRMGVFARDKNGVMQRLTGNQTGCLLADYVIRTHKEKGTLGEHGVFISTIVTSNLAGAIARHYGVDFYETLTGFKHICGKMRDLEEAGSLNFLFGFEESFGSLIGTHARDKDSFVSTLVLCEMLSWLKSRGMTMLDYLEEVFQTVGYYRDINISKHFYGLEGKAKMAAIMNSLRSDIPGQLGGLKVLAMRDYEKHVCTNLVTGEKSATDLPTSNVLSNSWLNNDSIPNNLTNDNQYPIVGHSHSYCHSRSFSP